MVKASKSHERTGELACTIMNVLMKKYRPADVTALAETTTTLSKFRLAKRQALVELEEETADIENECWITSRSLYQGSPTT